MTAPVVLVDVSNVRRSRWPNVPAAELVAAARRWADAEGMGLVLVFDGAAPAGDEDLVGSPGRTADELLAERAAGLRARGEPFWLVTSDRALRAEAGRGAERVIGGGGFLGLLGLRGRD